MREVKCKCGQTNYLVDIAGVECYDRARHGKVEDHPANNECVNCHGALEARKITKQPPPPPDPDPKDPPDPDAEIVVDLNELTIPQLKELAAERQIEIPKDVRKKADIVALLEMIEEAGGEE